MKRISVSVIISCTPETDHQKICAQLWKGNAMKRGIIILLMVFVSSLSSKSQTITALWSRSLDGYGDLDQYVAAGTDASGNIYVAGWTKKTSSDYNWIIMKYNSS